MYMSVEKELSRQVELSKWIDERLSVGYEFKDEKEKYAFACFDIGVEHHSSIILLVQSKLYGSALSLIRVQYESFVRGLWLKYASSGSEFEEYKKDKLNIQFGIMIKRVEEARGIESGILSYIKTQQWNIFNSFTHTGFEALVRRIGSASTGYDNYSEDEVVKILRYAGFFVLLAATELAFFLKSESVLKETLARVRGYGENI